MAREVTLVVDAPRPDDNPHQWLSETLLSILQHLIKDDAALHVAATKTHGQTHSFNNGRQQRSYAAVLTHHLVRSLKTISIKKCIWKYSTKV